MRGRCAAAAGFVACIGLAVPSLAQVAEQMPACDAPGMMPAQPANSHAPGSNDYPLLSMVLKEEGNTTLAIVVKEDGTVGNPRVTASSGSMRLDDAAIDMVTQRWRYKPAMQDGKPVACRWKVAVKWTIRDQIPILASKTSLVIQANAEDYPPTASESGEEGTVVLLVGVEADGSVTLATVLGSSGHSDLDAASVALVGSKIKAMNLQPSGKTLMVVLMVWSPKPK